METCPSVRTYPTILWLAVDPAGYGWNKRIFHELVEGNGATHNNLFTIDENGGVLTTKLFDYETDARSMSIRARATDPYGKSVENTFSISLVNHDRFSP